MGDDRAPTRVGGPERPRFWRFIVGIPLFVLALGLGLDACEGFPLSRGATSVSKWLLGVLGLGALYLLGEGAGEWISSKDSVTDPLWKRFLHLLALLALIGAFVAIVWLVQGLVQ